MTIVESGAFALMLLTAMSAAQAALSFAGRARGSDALVRAGEGAAVSGAFAAAAAFAALVWAFVASDFSVANVAANSHTDKPLFYKVTAAWGSHEGSMLLWCLALAGFGAALATRSGEDRFKPVAVGVQGATTFLFAAYTLFASNPFVRSWPPAIQGRGLNPVLQDPALAVHPPMLYAGYVGFSVVFAYALAALVEGRADQAWAARVRPWVLAAWSLLTVGITLGAFWAYYELGWGGWWFWDPVENASFMPWLAGAALLHSVIVTERRGALGGWTLFLSVLAFSFSMLGAFLVRSGVLTSVHAFAIDPERGLLLLAILAVVGGAGFALFAWRASALRRGRLFAPVSREGALVVNNLFICAATATVLLGTLYPLMVEAVTGRTISVGPPYFAATFVPIMASVLLITPIGPLLAWKRGDLPGALRRLLPAAVFSVVAALLAALLAETARPAVAAGAGLAAWLVFGGLTEPLERARVGQASAAETLRRSAALPRGAWGTALAHAGVGVFVLGACVQSVSKLEAADALSPGQSLRLGDRVVTLADVRVIEGPNYLAERARVEVRRRDGAGAAPVIAEPERRFFPAGGQTTSEVALRGAGLSDLYVVLGERRRGEDGRPAWLLRAYWNPLAKLIFAGPLLIAVGGLLALSDRRSRAARKAERPAAAAPSEALA